MSSILAQSPDSQISHSDALQYWNMISPTVDGMLGGYPQVSRIDLRGSSAFLAKLRRQHPGQAAQEMLERGVDCGAGIGRVTAGMLSKCCEIIDVVEPVEKFAIGVKSAKLAGKGKLGEIFITGLESWEPSSKYNLIWNQWCLGHLTDKQLISHLGRCREALVKDGWIVVKENMSTKQDGQDAFDTVDSSVTRTDQKFRKIFQETQLKIVRTELQAGFPRELYPVRLYALQPELSNT